MMNQGNAWQTIIRSDGGHTINRHDIVASTTGGEYRRYGFKVSPNMHMALRTMQNPGNCFTYLGLGSEPTHIINHPFVSHPSGGQCTRCGLIVAHHSYQPWLSNTGTTGSR